MADLPLHAATEAVLAKTAEVPTLAAIVTGTAEFAPGIAPKLVDALPAADRADQTSIDPSALLDAAQREAELQGDIVVRCEHLLIGAMRVLGDMARTERTRADYRRLMGDRAFLRYLELEAGHGVNGTERPSLVLFAGVPGTGKSTLAEALASALPAPVFSMDWQLGALVPFGVLRPDTADPMSELMLIAAAARQLQLRQSAIIDSTGHREQFRDRLRDLADSLGGNFVGVETVCSDESTARSRVQTRERAIPGWPATVTWEHVQWMRERWEPWNTPHLTIDTAHDSPADAVRRVLDAIAGGESEQSVRDNP